MTCSATSAAPSGRRCIGTGDILGTIADNGKPAPEPVHISGKLTDHGHGTTRIDDEVTVVSVERDGSAHFHDKPPIDIHLLPSLPHLGDIRRGFGEIVSEWQQDPYRDTHNGTVADLPRHETAVPGACDHYGDPCSATPDSGANPLPSTETVPLIGGKMDITDYLMKKVGMDPYAARKRKLLDDTFDERVQRGATHRSEDLARSAITMRENLDALWRATVDPAQRREALFEMWDECAEGDDATGSAGARARAEVIGWIRARLPAGSTGAFTPDDVARLSARRTSKQAFQPYED